MKRLFVFLALFLLAAFLSPKNILAQANTFGCARVPRGCAPANGTCQAGFKADLAYCGQLSQSECDNAPKRPCIADTCASLGGSCRSSCQGFGQAPSVSPQRDCSGGTICCISTGPATSQSTNSANDVTCDGGKGINTAIGCIPFGNQNEMLGFILKWAIGVGGGIAFLLVVYSSFMIISSSGNPERLKAGQELLTSAIMGVILLVFSVFILRIIGVDILKIPGFGAN